MSGNLMLLYIKETGHILSAVTGAADFGEAVTAKSLAGTALPVRYAGNATASGFADPEFFVPSDQLEVFPTEYNAATLARPRDSYVKTDVEPNKVEPLNLVLPPSIANPLVSNTQVLVSVAVPDNTKVWLQVVGLDPEDTQVKTGKFVTGVATVNLDPLKPNADYFVLVLAAGLGTLSLKTKTPP